MVKLILALPKHIDIEKFVALLATVLRGRYGENGYYGGGLYLDFQSIFYAYKVSGIYVHGFSGKGALSYYEKDAEELDPIIISTIDYLLQFIDGAAYAFVADKKILSQDWWKPYREFGTQPDVDSLDEYRDDYYKTLSLITSC